MAAAKLSLAAVKLSLAAANTEFGSCRTEFGSRQTEFGSCQTEFGSRQTEFGAPTSPTWGFRIFLIPCPGPDKVSRGFNVLMWVHAQEPVSRAFNFDPLPTANPGDSESS